MKISVSTFTGQSIELDVQPTDSIKQVKHLIRDTTGMPTHVQKLKFNNTKLTNGQTLAGCKVENNAVLHLLEASNDGSKIAAGGFGPGNRDNQFRFPYGLVLERDHTMIIVDWGNHRILEWKPGQTTGAVLVGNNRELSGPTDVVSDPRTNSLIICDRGNRRVVRWPRNGNAREGEVLLKNIACWGVALDDQGNLYVSDTETHTVKRYPYPPNDHQGDVVAGSREHGRGMQLDQLNGPSYIRVDRHQNVYVTDTWNHRVMKWSQNPQKAVVAARGFTRGLFVDDNETVYVADYGQRKIFRWPKDKGAGEEVNVRHMEGDEDDELFAPWSICYDGQNHIYVGDHMNQRVQRFPLK